MEITAGRGSPVKNLIKAVVFLLLLALMCSAVTGVTVNAGQDSTWQCFEGFYSIPENMLDTVFIGSSRVYAFWTPMFAWSEQGLATANVAAAEMPVRAVRYVIEEVLKRQPNALIVVNLDDFRTLKSASVQNVYAYMKNSPTRLAGIRKLADAMGSTFTERAAFLFPLIHFHSRWNELETYDFTKKLTGYCGSLTYMPFLNGTTDVAEDADDVVETAVLDEEFRMALEDLTDWLDENNVRVQFIASPQAHRGERKLEQRRASYDYMAERGYPVLDLSEQSDAMGLDFTQDYYNYTHTNIHGSLKYTRWLGNWLTEKYGLADRRGDTAYDFMTGASASYGMLTAPYALDIEFGSPRDYALEKPAGVEIAFGEQQTTAVWQPVEGADGYAVYFRKHINADQPFKLLGETAETQFIREGTPANGCWIVVPYREADGVKYYGNFDYRGTEAIQ